MPSWAWPTCGCTLIVGSMTTGYSRSFAVSQSTSGVTVRRQASPCRVSFCSTFVE